MQGFRFLRVLSRCPIGWKSEPEESVDLIRHAVRCGIFPLYEIYDGVRYRINERPDGTPVAEYITRQRRYTSLKVDPQRVKASIRKQWHYLDAMARAFPADG